MDDTVKPQFSAPQFTINPDLLHLLSFPQYSETVLQHHELRTWSFANCGIILDSKHYATLQCSSDHVYTLYES